MISSDYNISIALGDVPGKSLFGKWGMNSNISASGSGDIWNGGGVYTGFNVILGQGNSEKLVIFSSDTNDTDGGTGARTVSIENLLDDDGNVMPNKVVTLNGITPVEVDATQTYSRCSRIRVLTAGSGGSNAGTLTVRHITTTANVYAVMPVGGNQTRIACYTVPKGYKLLINKMYLSPQVSGGGAQSVIGGFYVRDFGEVFQEKLPIIASSSKEFLAIAEQYYYTIPELSDIKMRVLTASANNTVVVAAFGGTLINTTV